MSNINTQAAELWQRVSPEMPVRTMSDINSGIEVLEEAFKNLPYLRRNDRAPSFLLSSHTGETVNSNELYADGTTILFFYRGQWCPFCNLQLKAYAEQIEEFKKRGATLIAVSPEVSDYSKQAADDNDVNFDILFDQNNELGKKFGVSLSVPDVHIDVLKNFNIPLTTRNGVNNWELPIPGVFIIKNGIISDVLIDANYRKRAEVEDIIKLL